MEAAEAAKRHDVGALGHLLGELEEQKWEEPPPQSLVQGLRKVHAQFRGQQNLAILADLESELNDAFTSSNPIRGRLARDRWFTMVRSLQLSPKDPIHARVEAALLWLEEQDRQEEADRQHEAATQSLLQALDDRKRIGPAALEVMGNAVMGHGSGMSESLQRRYLERLWAEHAAFARWKQRILAGSLAAVVLVASLIFVAIRRQTRQNDAEQAATVVSDMLELSELEQASEFLKKLAAADPGLLEYPQMREVQSRFQAASDKEVERALKFDQAIRQADQAPVYDPKPAALETARSLARLATEKSAVEQLAERRRNALIQNRDQIDKEVAPSLDALGTKIAQMKSMLETAKPGSKEAAALTDLAAHVQIELASLGPKLAQSGDSVQALSRALAQDLDSIRTEITQRERRINLEERITRSVEYSAVGETSDLDPFADLLEQYVKAFADTPRSRALSQLARERPVWQSLLKWNRLVSSWRDQKDITTPEALHDRLERTTSFLAGNPWYPAADRVADYKKHLEAMSRRDDKADSPKRRLVQLFSDILVQSIWMVKVKDPNSTSKCYYMKQSPSEGTNLIHYLGGFDGRERARAIITAFIVYSDWSPQTKIANKYGIVLRQGSALTDWDRVMIGSHDRDSVIRGHGSTSPGRPAQESRRLCDRGERAVAGSPGPEQGASRARRRRCECPLDGSRQCGCRAAATEGPGARQIASRLCGGAQGSPSASRTSRAGGQGVSPQRGMASEGGERLASSKAERFSPARGASGWLFPRPTHSAPGSRSAPSVAEQSRSSPTRATSSLKGGRYSPCFDRFRSPRIAGRSSLFFKGALTDHGGSNLVHPVSWSNLRSVHQGTARIAARPRPAHTVSRGVSGPPELDQRSECVGTVLAGRGNTESIALERLLACRSRNPRP